MPTAPDRPPTPRPSSASPTSPTSWASSCPRAPPCPAAWSATPTSCAPPPTWPLPRPRRRSRLEEARDVGGFGGVALGIGRVDLHHTTGDRPRAGDHAVVERDRAQHPAARERAPL